MPERTNVQKVEPRHSIEFVDPANIPEASADSSQFAHNASVVFDDKTGNKKLLVIRSDDERLVTEMSGVAKDIRNEPVAEEQLRQRLARYSSRLPNAYILYGALGSEIVCGEPSCKYHFDCGCTNEEPVIQDDCFEDSWCMTYELAERDGE